MSSQWTNKYAIMRDLSLAQGCVPVEIERTIGQMDKPPALDIVEDTEEEFFMKHCSGDATTVGPDLGLIKTMLNLVRVEDDSDPEENFENSSKLIEITKKTTTKLDYDMVNNNSDAKHERKVQELKLNPHVTEFIPTNTFYNSMIRKQNPIIKPDSGDFQQKGYNVPTPTKDFTVPSKIETVPSEKVTVPTKDATVQTKTKVLLEALKPKKTKKNVAMDSLLDIIGIDQSPKLLHNNNENKTDSAKTFVLSKPNDFKTRTATVENVKPTAAFNKVNSWLNTSAATPKRSVCLIKPTAMFRRKSDSPAKSPVACYEAPTTKVSHEIKEYRPSKWAETYKRTYEERANMQVILNEDVWARTERQMKELDYKRQLELLKFETSISQANSESQAQATTEHGIETKITDEQDGSIASTPTHFEDQKFLDVILPQHRHLLAGECIVCETLKAHQTKHVD